ncbi:SDR family NAD(P)-dependent oxidoreductase [Luteolibacter algae]|uniref:SDR family NAD(P)-dependent oxidoreductase n=1 Tax=Luteolibacter algae TaxID=454151 RepID=A0ABW5D385_9BACT
MKRVIITGGTGGLGSAIAKCFKSENWEVIALGRQDLDLLDETALAAYFEKNPCDLLICAAGIIRDEPIKRMTEDHWDKVFSVNFRAATNCAIAALPGMVKRGIGHIIFISSYAAERPTVGQAAYATAKASLTGLTKDLAECYGSKGIRVNAISPGFLETPMTDAVLPRRKEIVRDLHFLGQFNTAEIAAKFIGFLHEHLPFTSGQVFHLDSRP